jgi:cytochrome c553
MNKTHVSLLMALLLTTALTACGKKEEAAAPAGESQAPQTTEAAAPVAAATADAAAPAADGAMVDATAKYTASCASCHGELGEGVGKNPKLAGLKRADIKAKLMDYRAGKQMGPQTAIMAATAKTLTDAEIEALGDYLGE